ncbi:peptide ABC transporter substrate-binding protein [Clostridium sp. P21]|uniref:Peptide ABC transporter substrate-binding protein n=1 Tax=Clostridium muellerianum TaxID=2716538 RepID=A0A7Y0HP22_9CLOT|nr:peptide ABC transporter substrate-binding protein [Clostridium muellerianum]NMM63242.1 peptide ABC transporter substrate-binding protein [Clostridium muellerianum]
MKKIIFCLLIISFTFFNGCIEKDVQSSKSMQVRNYIVCSVGEMSKDLIMLNDYNLRQQDLLTNLFEGLVRIDETGKVTPAIAQSWSLNKEETCYTFKIKDSAKWSDGTSITAEDFVVFFKEILSKDSENVYAEQLYCVFGAENYRNGKCDFNNVAIRALDAKTLEIRLNYPCCYFLNILSEPIYGIRKMDTKLKNWNKDFKSILYSGYFVIGDFKNTKEVILRKNKYYWNKDSVKSDRLHLVFNEGSETSLAAFQNSKIDLFTNPPVSEVKKLIDKRNILEQQNFSVGALVFNLKKDGIVNDINFRKAVSECIDRNAIVKNVLNDLAKPGVSFIPPGVSDSANGYYINKEFLSASIQKDKALNFIKNSKYNKDKDSLKIIYLDAVENKKICESVAKNLKENLEIKVECIGYGKEEFSDEIKKNDYDIASIQYEAAYNYPLSFLEQWQSVSHSNIYGYKSVEFDNSLTKIKMENNKDKKITMARISENMLMQDMPVVPVYFNSTLVCKKTNITGVHISKKGSLDFHALETMRKP